MRVLRLTTSNDTYPAVAEELRAPAVCARLIGELTGESAESMHRNIWPSDVLPDLVSKWMDDFQPDVVLVRPSAFWTTHEMIWIGVDRHLGAPGRALAKLMKGTSEQGAVGGSRAFEFARGLVVRAYPGQTHMTPEEATERIAPMLRQIVAKESAIVVVRGPAPVNNAARNPAGLTRGERRLEAHDRLMAALCRERRIPYSSALQALNHPHLLMPDQVHSTEKGHRIAGEFEGKMIAEAWLAAKART
ncbi:MAG: SGNH/GDSL hydrolase family protein [Tepidiformaceae bacterium]